MKSSATLSSHLLALLLLPLLSQAATFTVVNQCSYTVWPAAANPSGGHRLDPGETWVFNVTPGNTTTGRVWARTGCIFDGRGNGSCQTGDCGGALHCTGFGQPPCTLAEYTLNQFQNKDFYDVSLVDGFNVPMDFAPTSGGCHDIRCAADIAGQCPGPLQAPGGCNNPCTAFKNNDYCCTGSGSGSGSSCKPTNFSMFFKNRCGEAYSYPLDDPNTFSCPSGTDYRVTFCPCLSENSVGNYTLNGALCTCAAGFKGNAYVPGGCQDINECQDPVTYRCLGTCVNEPGTYRCFCPNGTHGDPRADGCHPINPNSGGGLSALASVLIGVGIALGLLLLLVVIVLLTRKLKARRVRKLKAKYFMQNKGLLLQKLISSNKDAAERMKIFTIEELAKATNNFDRTRILGSGGHGTVYKGILSDLRVVAIKKCTLQRETKKSEMKVQTEIDQFINEVVILSQVSHRNVVNLFGCCLETEVPLLVYEFISNGTLSHHLHAPDRSSSLSWDDRLRIAVETARALSYLHAAASISVFHRDIKSTNILLDDGLTAKVSDFGASRLVLPDQSRITTAIQGTFGYLDPEYFHTGQLTEKSDVYSFGVILVELLTGEKPISPATLPEGRNLATHFIWLMRENCLYEILEARVVEEGEKEAVEAVAALADTCLRLKGEERPTMKEVEMRIEALINSKKQLQHPRIAHESNEMECLEGQPETDGNNGDESRQYRMEKEFILSSSFPR